MEGRELVTITINGIQYTGWATIELMEQLKRDLKVQEVVNPSVHPGQTDILTHLDSISDHVDRSVIPPRRSD